MTCSGQPSSSSMWSRVRSVWPTSRPLRASHPDGSVPAMTVSLLQIAPESGDVVGRGFSESGDVVGRGFSEPAGRGLSALRGDLDDWGIEHDGFHQDDFQPDDFQPDDFQPDGFEPDGFEEDRGADTDFDQDPIRSIGRNADAESEPGPDEAHRR